MTCAAVKKNCNNRPVTNGGDIIDGHDFCRFHYMRLSMGLDKIEDYV